MVTLHLIPDDVATTYEVREWRTAAGVQLLLSPCGLCYAWRMSLDVRPSGDPRDQTAAAPSTGRSLCFFLRRSTPENDLNAIRDSRFMNQFANLDRLKTLLLTRGVPIREEDVSLLSFGALNHLRYSEKGRLPTIEEWEQLDMRSQKLFSYLDDGLRKRFELSQAANLIAGLPIFLIFVALLFVAVLSLIAANFAVERSLLLLFCYSWWAALLGAIGAIAFLSMNTLSIQDDITFDFTNKSILAVRIVLGQDQRGRVPGSSRARIRRTATPLQPGLRGAQS
jgi:hypothetical protein